MIRNKRTRRKSGSRIILYIIALLALGVMHLYNRFVNREHDSEMIELINSSTAESSPNPKNTTQSGEEADFESESAKTAPSNSKQQKRASSTKTKSTNNNIYRTGWAELPAEKSDKTLYYTHHIIAEEARRNYSACFSSRHHCPVWIAYPLHTSYKGETKRSDSFDYDPTIPINIQPQLRRSFGEFTRGHLLGSAERTSSSEANRQTFYATNIAPQIQNGFNASNGAWNNLERFVSRQICSDTLYVVTGCLFTDYSDISGIDIEASTTINKNDGKNVAVPTAFYKVLLRTRKGNTGRSVYDCGSEELKCAAFIVGHYSAAGRKPSKEIMMSVHDLEKLTGIEFFAGVSNAPKQSVNVADWRWK